MPKSIVFSNGVLLLCLSALAGSAVVSLLGGEVAFSPSGVSTLTIAGLVCGVVMCVSEFFSGIRWLPIVAVAALVVGRVAMGDHSTAPRLSEFSWLVGWVSVAVWFACLAAKAREDR